MINVSHVWNIFFYRSTQTGDLPTHAVSQHFSLSHHFLWRRMDTFPCPQIWNGTSKCWKMLPPPPKWTMDVDRCKGLLSGLPKSRFWPCLNTRLENQWLCDTPCTWHHVLDWSTLGWIMAVDRRNAMALYKLGSWTPYNDRHSLCGYRGEWSMERLWQQSTNPQSTIPGSPRHYVPIHWWWGY